MRVLLNFRSGFAGLREGFAALGHQVLEEIWLPDAAGLDGVGMCIADFVDCARNLRRTVLHSRLLRRHAVPFLALNRDAPWHRGVHRRRLTLIAALAPFDGYAAHSMQDAVRYSRRTVYCPNAARESLYYATAADLEAMRDPAYFKWDVSFLGNLDVARYPEHRLRAEFFRALEERLRPLGLRVLFRDSTGVPAGEQLEIIRRSRINLSALAACDAGAERSWGLPERCYGVPACGGFLLSDARSHAPDDFDAGERAQFEGLDDCVARIRHFLARPEAMRAIAERAHARVLREHLYRHRAARLIDFSKNAY